MKKFIENLASKIPYNYSKVAFGVFVCLISIFGALSTAQTNDGFIYLAKFINWCISFLVGSIIAYFMYFVGFLCGLRLIFSTKKKAKVTLNLAIFGIILALTGAIIIITNSMSYSNGNYLTFDNFEKYFNDYVVSSFPNVESFKNGGVIGMSLVSIINSGMTYIGSYVIGSILLCLGSILALGKVTIRSFKALIDYKNQVFGRKIAENDQSFEVAKDVKVNDIPAEEQEAKKSKETTTKKVESSFAKPNMNDINNLNNDFSHFENKINTIPSNVSSTDGLVKVTFNPNINEEVESQKENVADDNTKVSIESQEENNDIVKENNNINFNTNNLSINELNKQYQSGSSLSEVTQKTFRLEEEQEDIPDIDKVVEKYDEPKVESVQTYEELNENNSINDNNDFGDFKTENQEIYRNEPQVEQENKTYVEPKVEMPVHQTQVIPEPVQPQKTNYENQIKIKTKTKKKFVYPSTNLLAIRDSKESDKENEINAQHTMININSILDDFKVRAKVVSYTIGPSVTRYELETEKSASVKEIQSIVLDLSIKLGGTDCRFVPIVPGKTTSGIEIANKKISMVNFKDCFEALPESNEKTNLYIPFGKDISGNFIQADFKDFPHLLVCGTTGSGKSIFMHSVILSLIMRNSCDSLKMIMIDPKKVEFSKYKEMPHLLCPPISEPPKAYVALLKLVDEMENRYQMFEELGVSNIQQYNAEALQNGREKLPYIVLVCDEFADLMDTNRKCAEPIVRIGQKARASGIHMIIATQRPTTNVITGTIKANLPVRVALSVASSTDSVTILGEGGAEKLLGKGDMLVSCSLISKVSFIRCQGCFVDNKEIKTVVDFLKENNDVSYDDRFLNLEERSKCIASSDDLEDQKERAYDEKYEEIKKWVCTQEYTSMSKIQREFGLGYPRASKMFEMLVQDGYVSDANEPNNSKGRKVIRFNPGPERENGSDTGSIEQSTMDYTKFSR